MADKRIFNFSAGPSMLPEQVLKTASEQMLNYKGSGMSVMEMSHRSSAYDQIIKDAQQRLRDLLQIPDNYKVLFLQGGASTQFAAIPMNLLRNGIADYVITGHFAKKAYEEAKKYGAVNVAATTEDEQFARIPKQEELKLHEDADYVYLCCNIRFTVRNGIIYRIRTGSRSLRTCPAIFCQNRSMSANTG